MPDRPLPIGPHVGPVGGCADRSRGLGWVPPVEDGPVPPLHFRGRGGAGFECSGQKRSLPGGGALYGSLRGACETKTMRGKGATSPRNSPAVLVGVCATNDRAREEALPTLTAGVGSRSGSMSDTPRRFMSIAGASGSHKGSLGLTGGNLDTAANGQFPSSAEGRGIWRQRSKNALLWCRLPVLAQGRCGWQRHHLIPLPLALPLLALLSLILSMI